MKRGTYVGHLEHLQGKTAILRDDFGPAVILAQFDDVTVTLDGRPVPLEEAMGLEPHDRFPTIRKGNYEDPPPESLGYGWHLFHPWEFEMEETP